MHAPTHLCILVCCQFNLDALLFGYSHQTSQQILGQEQCVNTVNREWEDLISSQEQYHKVEIFLVARHCISNRHFEIHLMIQNEGSNYAGRTVEASRQGASRIDSTYAQAMQ